MTTKIFVNLPVKELDLAIAFYKKLGYTFNQQFTDATAGCMVISEDIYAMLLTHAKFREFTPNPICDAKSSTEVLVCLSCDSKQHVDDLIKKAISAGGTTFAEPKDYGFMYSHSYRDLDGHIWELIYMDPSAIQKT